MSILEKLMFDELWEAVVPFLNAAQEALSQVPNPLPSWEALPLVPDQNPFPVEDISLELDLDSVKEVLRNRLIIHWLGRRGRIVSDDDIALIIGRKGENPFKNVRVGFQPVLESASTYAYLGLHAASPRGRIQDLRFGGKIGTIFGWECQQ